MGLYDLLVLAVYVYALVVVLVLISEERDPSTTLAWALTLIIFPGVGLGLFLLFGRNLSRTGKRDRRRREAKALTVGARCSRYKRWSAGADAAIEALPGYLRRLPHLIERQNGTRPLPAVDLEIFGDGAAKFERLFADIAAATDHVHLEYFIWEQDVLTARLSELLAGKVAEGVEVRVLYDWVGSLPYGKRELNALAAAGAKVVADSANWSRFNYRNHRKIAVIDGRIAYTGGMNVGQEYIDGKPRFASWRDTHVRFEGPLVAELQCLFAERWYRVTEEELYGDRYLPELDTQGASRISWGQVAHSGPESELEELRNAYLVAIAAAERSVKVQSPYFVPDDAILEALVTQSLAGVDVQFMMTGIPDKKIAWSAAFSYIDELIDADGRVFQYDAGFFHPKTMTIDGRLGVIGTTNFDIRSFMLHDELSIFFYDETVAAEIEAAFDEDRKRCHAVDQSAFEKMGAPRRFVNALARLASRLL